MVAEFPQIFVKSDRKGAGKIFGTKVTVF